jgi:dephospho-CoA kinase
MGIPSVSANGLQFRMKTLVCFSGQIGSGKSSASTAVAAALGWRRTGFGDYLRAEIERAGGDPACREALQELGQRLVEADAESFCRSVLDAGGFTPGDDFIVDGVRHVKILRILTRLAEPSATRLLFLSADDARRLVRVEGRPDKADFVRASMHRVEAELQNDLPALADAVIDATRSFAEVVAACLAEISAWRQR